MPHNLDETIARTDRMEQTVLQKFGEIPTNEEQNAVLAVLDMLDDHNLDTMTVTDALDKLENETNLEANQAEAARRLRSLCTTEDGAIIDPYLTVEWMRQTMRNDQTRDLPWKKK